MKSEVYTLASEIGIIEDIMKAKPTDGLWNDGRTDEDQLGVSYDDLEWAMLKDELDNSNLDLSSDERNVLDIYKSVYFPCNFFNFKSSINLFEIRIVRVEIKNWVSSLHICIISF